MYYVLEKDIFKICYNEKWNENFYLFDYCIDIDVDNYKIDYELQRNLKNAYKPYITLFGINLNTNKVITMNYDSIQNCFGIIIG